MSAPAIANPSVESKSARKKKAKAELAAPATPTQDQHHGSEVNGSEAGGESNYVKELQKNVRNVTKKLNLMQKVDAIIADNPDSTLEELVASKKINADQRAQALKKPQLQAQLTQLEDQLAQYKKVDQEYQQKVTAERELLQSTHKAELEKLRDVVKAEAAAEEIKNLKQRYLTLSKFLHAAAAKRQLEEPDTEERQAFEGVLLLVYGGDANAVEAIEKLVEGSEDVVNTVEGLPTKVSFAQIREASLSTGAEEVAQPTEPEQTTEPEAATTDPTIANAGLTELEDNTAAISLSEPADSSNVPAAASIGADASNAAADEQWDQAAKSGDHPLAESFEMVPRDPTETETGATPAANNSTQSWADDTPAETTVATPAGANGNDGFHEVHHQRGGRGRGGDGRGQGRGRGRGGDRGRGGYRGDGRGRGGGRGGYRGRGGPRGDAAPAAS